MSHSSLEAPRLSLEFIRKRAKRLHKRFLQGDEETRNWFYQNHPLASDRRQSGQPIKLADIQWAISRDYGLPSWPALVKHVNDLEFHRRAIATTAPPLDTDSTLHLRCGSDIRQGLKIAGFCGEFLEFSDPFCQGPVPVSNLLEARVQFISQAYKLPKQEVEVRQKEEYQALSECWDRYERVVLWFEHDSYDQLILVYILAHMPESAVDKTSLINIDRFPAIKRFHGLGNLDPEGLRSLWKQQITVTSGMKGKAKGVWRALTCESPGLLEAEMNSDSSDLPFMAGAVLRHLQELPSLFNGLSLTQQLTLEAMRNGPVSGGQIFGHLVRETEPRVFLGDLMFFAELNSMRAARRVPFDVELNEAPQPWPKRVLKLNDTGNKLLTGELDWSQCHPPERWVGGVRLAATPWYRWYMAGGKLELTQK
ncbi:DUF1835 domain-containing protein [Hahella ganghwensis]|uniref:DUF1835 domain-containing protein n=1 Tax=Hahella ganghwensis TaxID=286420 RepID=UPI0003793DBF|nr:DUF1835 domain-containing protein [Hahella ganghwensis]